MLLLLIFLVLVVLVNCNINYLHKKSEKFHVVYEWKTIDFNYENKLDRKKAKINGDFIPKNVLISDIKAYSDRLYLTIPRLLNGVPATLGWIPAPIYTDQKIETIITNPFITPFPSWEYNKEGDCRAMQFVQGIAIDDTGLMWIIDAGKSQTLLNDENAIICIPKLLIVDLKNDNKIIQIYEFPEEVVAYGQNYLSKIVIDDAYGGFAYITDNSVTDPGIVVYFRKLNYSWKIREKNSMTGVVDAVDFNINGTSLRFLIHINSIAIGPYIKGNKTKELLLERNIYYSPLSSYHLYSIPASILRNPQMARSSNTQEMYKFVTDYGLKSSQTDGMIMDSQGILYYSLLQQNEIAQWNSFKPFKPYYQKIIARDKNFIQWIDGMSFDKNRNLYVVVNRLLNFMSGPINTNDVNFRILKAYIAPTFTIMNTGQTISHFLPFINKYPRVINSYSSSTIIFSNWDIIYVIVIGLKVIYMYNLYLH